MMACGLFSHMRKPTVFWRLDLPLPCGQGCIQGWAAAPPPQTPLNLNLENTCFVDIMITKVLSDLPLN
jgi:hypothetical protein